MRRTVLFKVTSSYPKAVAELLYREGQEDISSGLWESPFIFINHCSYKKMAVDFHLAP
ncbi:hypothetical protein GHK52_04810 [Lactococcus garvieae]|nr:hypothetical protein [Lactococcus garvieae]